MTARRRWGLVVSAGLAIAALVSAGRTVLPQHPLLPEARRVQVLHEDPSVGRVDQDATALLRYINDTVQFIGTQRFSEAGSQLSALKLVSVSPSLRRLVDQVGEEVEGLSTGMKEMDRAIVQAQEFLQANRRAEAREVLTQARQLLRRNGGFIQDNRRTLAELAYRLGVPGLPAVSPARRVFERIQRGLSVLDARERRIADLLDRIEKGDRASHGTMSTSVQWVVSGQAYPARPFVVSGVVATTGGSDVPMELVFDLDDRILGRLLAHGRFRVALSPPADSPPGWHALTILVEARGEYAEFTETRPLELIRYPITVGIDPVRVATLPGVVTISGWVASQFGPLERARIEVRLGAAAGVTEATREGKFRVTVAPPFTPTLVGSQRVRVNVVPADPWEAPVEAETRAMVVNLVNLSLASVVAPLTAVYVRTRRRRMHEGESVWASPAAEIRGEVPDTVGTTLQHLEPAAEDSDLSSGAHLMRLYGTAVREIEEKKNVRFLPHMTMREFHQAAVTVLKGPAFERVTALAELALYSSRPITGEQLAAMLSLGKDLDEELRDGRA